MRSIVAALLFLQFALTGPALAQPATTTMRPMAEMLPLFAKNKCAELRDMAEQLFCGDPDLNALTPKLSAALESRFSRVLDRRAATAENVEWIKARDSSCGLFGLQPVQPGALAVICPACSRRRRTGSQS